MLDVALKVLKEITSHGFKAYIVGGFVRDHLLDIESNDIDITTNATPKELIEIFPESCLPNEEYGSVIISRGSQKIEITTFRKEIEYDDYRKPLQIEYINDLYPDLLRRDFTINALCIDDNGYVIDYLGGKEDLDNKLVKPIGDPNVKFEEDPLRILRAIRFSTVLGFDLSEDIVDAIKKNKHLVANLSYFRKKSELEKIFVSSNRRNGIELLLYFGLDEELELPNLKKLLSVNTTSLIGIWRILDVAGKYPFNKNELDLINDINAVMPLNNLDPMALYKYGLYANSVAGEIKDIDIKSITESYAGLVIKRRQDIDITSDEIIELLGIEPGKILKNIYDDIEREILYHRLENSKDKISAYILANYNDIDKDNEFSDNNSFKGIISIILILSIFFSPFIVNARSYSSNEVFSIDTPDASFSSDTFDYNGIHFDKSGYLIIDSVTNKSGSRKPYSINILMFDSQQKNIGYITYCSTKDLDSDYSDKQLSGGASDRLQIPVTKKYFGAKDKEYKGEVKTVNDVFYISVVDDNTHCQIGGYSKYIGLTINEITNGKVVKEVKEKNGIPVLINKYVILLVPSLLGILAVCFACGFFLNALYKRMKADTSVFSYLPVTNFFVAIKLAFGEMISYIAMLFAVFGCLLYTSGYGIYVFYGLGGFIVLAVIVDIVKFVTGKYDLFYFEPFNNTNRALINEQYATKIDNEPIINTDFDEKKEEKYESPSDLINIFNSSDNNSNISYGDSILNSYDNNLSTNINENFVGSNIMNVSNDTSSNMSQEDNRPIITFDDEKPQNTNRFINTNFEEEAEENKDELQSDTYENYSSIETSAPLKPVSNISEVEALTTPETVPPVSTSPVIERLGDDMGDNDSTPVREEHHDLPEGNSELSNFFR